MAIDIPDRFLHIFEYKPFNLTIFRFRAIFAILNYLLNCYAKKFLNFKVLSNFIMLIKGVCAVQMIKFECSPM